MQYWHKTVLEALLKNRNGIPEIIVYSNKKWRGKDIMGTPVYYIPHIHKVKIRYVEPNNTANYITWIDNNKIINIFTEIYNSEQITDMHLEQFSEIFVETDQ